jgi:hypothetical protein
MKKLILSLTIGLVGMTTYAQTSRYELGFNIGPNLNGYRGTAFDDAYYDPFLFSYETEKVLGTSYGLSLQYNFGDLKKSKVISLLINPTFDRKHYSTNTHIDNQNYVGYESNITSKGYDNFIGSPILLRATFGNKSKFFLNAGPYFGCFTNSVWSTNQDGFQTNGDTVYSKHFDAGLSIGLGLRVPINDRLGFSFELRNNLGLKNLSYSEQFTSKLNTTNLSLGLTYNLGKIVQKDIAKNKVRANNFLIVDSLVKDKSYYSGLELQTYAKHHYTGLGLTIGGSGLTLLGVNLIANSTRQVPIYYIYNGVNYGISGYETEVIQSKRTSGYALSIIGGIASLIGTYYIIEAPIHIKRAGLILSGNSVGLKIKL